MKVSIVGTGYVGLVTGACLAEKGHHVVCVDLDRKKVDAINRAIPPIYEKGLKELLDRNVNVRLRATTDLDGAVIGTEVTVIAVGTPFDGHEIDLSSIKDASRQIGKTLKNKSDYHAVITKSTVVPGTTDQVVLPLLEESSGKRAGVGFGMGTNPEFLTEGQAVSDFMNPDRIVIGACDEKTMRLLEELYSGFENVPKVRTNNKTAEMIKYASNAMLATQISFANEIANLCSALGGIDIVDVMKGVHLSYYLRPTMENGTRIQAPISSFLEAGCGFGGSCLPKDVKTLIAYGGKLGREMPLLRAVIGTNEQQPQKVINILKKHFSSLAGIRIGILGLAFKPDTDDMRGSPAIPIVKLLQSQRAVVKAYDPVAMDEARRIFDGDTITFAKTLEECLSDVDAVVLVTRWKEFESIPELLEGVHPQPLFVDGRRQLDKRLFERYDGIGL